MDAGQRAVRFAGDRLEQVVLRLGQLAGRGEKLRSHAGAHLRGTAGRLDSDLDHAVRIRKRVAHPSGLIRIEGHGFFLVHVFAGLNSGDKIQYVVMLRSCDQHRIDTFVVQQTPKIRTGLDSGSNTRSVFQTLRINVRHRYRLSVGRFNRCFKNRLASPPAADQRKADAIVCPQDAVQWMKTVCSQKGCAS